MGHFSVRVMYRSGKPANDGGVMIDYCSLAYSQHIIWAPFN